MTTRTHPGTSPLPAPIGRRAAAIGLDYLIIATYLAVVVGLGAALNAAVPATMRTVCGEPSRAELIGFISLTLPGTLDFGISEASRRHATWSKREKRDLARPAGFEPAA